jgi:hypothetical protein
LVVGAAGAGAATGAEAVAEIGAATLVNDPAGSAAALVCDRIAESSRRSERRVRTTSWL